MIEADYFKATSTAYEILKRYDGGFPKIDVMRIAMSDRNICVHTYSQAACKMEVSFAQFLTDYTESEMGYTVYDKARKRWLIYYNNAKSEATIRFTIAHELGHVFLGHTDDNPITDKEANCFARNLLCPYPLREKLIFSTAADYCKTFGISEPMAEVVIDKFDSDMYYYRNANCSILCHKGG